MTLGMMSVAIRTAEPAIEVRPDRRGLSTGDTLRILAEADACTERGAMGAWLRRTACVRPTGPRGGLRPRLGSAAGVLAAKMPGSATSSPARRATWPKPAR